MEVVSRSSGKVSVVNLGVPAKLLLGHTRCELGEPTCEVIPRLDPFLKFNQVTMTIDLSLAPDSLCRGETSAHLFQVASKMSSWAKLSRKVSPLLVTLSMTLAFAAR